MKEDKKKKLVSIVEEGESNEKNRVGLYRIERVSTDDGNKKILKKIAEEIEKEQGGYEGQTKECKGCGELSRFKGYKPRVIELESGVLELQRASYYCKKCKRTNYPLDEKLSLEEGRMQGSYRTKIEYLGLITPYNQIKQSGKILLNKTIHSNEVRRVVCKLSISAEESKTEHTICVGEKEVVYLESDGVLCPTREAKISQEDAGFRESKSVMGFKASDVRDSRVPRSPRHQV